jgi:hypothetical protein
MQQLDCLSPLTCCDSAWFNAIRGQEAAFSFLFVMDHSKEKLNVQFNAVILYSFYRFLCREQHRVAMLVYTVAAALNNLKRRSKLYHTIV